MRTVEFTVFHLFCGIGGGALGFAQAWGEWRGLSGRFRTLGGVDCDPDACADFERLVGVPATCLDLFSRQDYEAFHGCEPPADWREATADDLREAAGWERPDVLFLSPPCKGFSALLPRRQAETDRYQALNRLVVRGLSLALEAWGDDPPGLILLENVPRITSRGAELLSEIKGLLGRQGYILHEGTHDAGELGGLAQHRRRYLLIARHQEKVPAFVYQPPKRRVKSIGEVLGPLPLPDDPAGGPMHRLPRLAWRTWVRLALIPAGRDWRALKDLSDRDWHASPYRIVPWDEPARTVTSGSSPSCGPVSVADPRLPDDDHRHHNKYRVESWDEPSHVITGSDRIGSGAPAIADPRVSPKRGRTYKGSPGLMGVLRWDGPAQAVTGRASASSSNCPAAVADPRLGHAPRKGVYRVAQWDGPSTTIVGAASVRGSNGVAAVSDPRLACHPRSGAYRVIRWDEPSTTVTGAGDVHAQGAASVADPRLPADTDQGVWLIVAEDGTWHRPLTTLELAVLQDFPATLPDGRPLELAGQSHARWRERIGNAVPPRAARAIGKTMLRALLPATEGAWTLSQYGTPIWVHPDEVLDEEAVVGG